MESTKSAFNDLPASGLPEAIARRTDYLGREEVLKRLNIKQQTLYAYVSRGYIRRVAHPDGRSSYYVREDVEKVRSRSATRAGHGAIAAAAMHYGEPVVTTAITEITDEGPRYRGRLAYELARTRVPFENAAEFLWSGKLSDEPVLWRLEAPAPAGFAELLGSMAKLHRNAHIVQIMSAAVLGLGTAAGPRRERIRAGHTMLSMARQLILCQTGTLGLLGPKRRFQPVNPGESLAQAVTRLLNVPGDPGQLAAINAALVIAADHELNPATFAARVAASGSSDVHSCIAAALSTHYGTLVGRACDRVEALFEPPAAPDDTLARAKRLLDAARSLPGFDHPLYPRGDPRARYLVECALVRGGARPMVRNMRMVIARLEEDYGVRPAIEFGLVMLCRALGLPDRTASALYALGRMAGWIAHIEEQRLAGFVIRPRAKFAADPLYSPTSATGSGSTR
jgi:citrate synthase